MRKFIIIKTLFIILIGAASFCSEEIDVTVVSDVKNNLIDDNENVTSNYPIARSTANRNRKAIMSLRKRLKDRLIEERRKKGLIEEGRDLREIKKEIKASAKGIMKENDSSFQENAMTKDSSYEGQPERSFKKLESVLCEKSGAKERIQKALSKIDINNKKTEPTSNSAEMRALKFDEIARDEKVKNYESTLKLSNDILKELKSRLSEKYTLVTELYNQGAGEEELTALKNEIKEIKEDIFEIERQTKGEYLKDTTSTKEQCYAYWDQGDATLSQLVMEYGSTDYLYVIPPELTNMKISIFSSIPIPHESWDDMIEMILRNNGVGIKKLSPYLRQLYILKQDLSYVEAVTADLNEVMHLSGHSPIFYVFSPRIENVKSVQAFFERYSDPKQVSVQIVGNKVVVVGGKDNVTRLMKLYDAIWEKDGQKVVKVVNLYRCDPIEVEKIVKAFFVDKAPQARGPFFQSKLEELIVTPLPNASSIVLVGEGNMVNRAQKLIKDLEEQLQDPSEMTLYWYTCKHSEPNELAEILNRVYASLATVSMDKEQTNSTKQESTQTKQSSGAAKDDQSCSSMVCYGNGRNVYNPVNPVETKMVMPGVITSDDKKSFASNNFVVDGKTGSILMIVQRSSLKKLKSLIKRLDVPKKMVQIDVLLVEKKLQDKNQAGINILKIGTNDVTEKKNAFSFDASSTSKKKGILDFLFMKPKGHFPSFDLTLSFLMAQQDLQINANPSVLAVNQTPAEISIVEEISINNGAVIKDCPTGSTTEQSYTRSQYGITIKMTPTIHLAEKNKPEEKGFVTLQTDVLFDTPELSDDNHKPPVTRRHVQNEVRVADGETIIIGGLRKQAEQDNREKIPFLGDLPGIGKLFGTTKVTKSSTEMFIFITPKIVKDPIEDLRNIRQVELCKRAGDVPEFLEAIEKAKAKERNRMFKNSLKVLFD